MPSHTMHLQPGMDVFASDGEKVGSIGDVGRTYIHVQKGLIFVRDLYIPHSAIDRVDMDENAVMLNVAKDGVESIAWDSPPADDVDMTEDRYEATGSTTERDVDTETVRVPRYEEELRAEKATRDAGEVEIRKDVVEEERQLDVPVTREEVEVRRVPADEPADAAAFSAGDEVLRVPVREEQVEVTKQPRLVEEVEVQKRPVTETQRVADTVRRETVDVDRSDATRAGSGTSGERTGRTYSDAETDTRRTGSDREAGVEAAGAGAGAIGGAVLGGALAGPPGAVVGGVAGGAVGGVAGEAAESGGEEGGSGVGGGAGAVAGAVAGGAVAGPPGAFVGGAVGAGAGAGLGDQAQEGSEDDDDVEGRDRDRA